MLGAILTLFVALGAEPWWTLNGTTNARLFSIQVSPFLVHISATGLPTSVPYANILGSITRTLSLVGFVALFAASIRPTGWWRNLAAYFGLSSLAELYLSFLLMFYWTQTTFLNTYGIVLPYYGTATLPTNIVGLDFGYYASPLVTASFNLSFYLGFLCVGLIMSRTLIKILHDRAFQILSVLLPNGVGIHDIRLSPPYQQVWFSTGDEQYNPIWKFLGGVGDDQLLISFKKLFETVEPGGSISVVLPAGATILSEKLGKLMPQIGFIVDETRTINTGQDKVEMELRFTRPAREQPETSETLSTERATTLEPSPVESANLAEISDDSLETQSRQEHPSTPEVPVRPETLPTLEVVEQPPELGQKLTRLERTVLRSAVRAITERHQPVPYRELLNEVYMDLVDRNVEFDSARQIETTLLDHNGREVVLLDESDGPKGRAVKKWGLGKQRLRSERSVRIPGLNRVKAVGPRITGIRKIIRRPRESNYRMKLRDQDDAGDQSP